MKYLYIILGVGLLYILFRQTTPATSEIQSDNYSESIGDIILGKVYAVTQDTKANESKWAPVIADAEALNGIPDGLLHRQLYQESHFRSDIIGETPDGNKVIIPTISAANAQGIAQIVPRWHPNINPWDVRASIYYAASFMKRLYGKFGNWESALAAYNWGEGNISRAPLYDSWPPETQNYVTQITNDVQVA